MVIFLIILKRTEGNIVNKINATVMDILGSRDLKPFDDSCGKSGMEI